MKFFSFLTIAVLLIFGTSCNKKVVKTHFYLDAEFKEYFAFDYKVGTKLIYVDTVSQTTNVIELVKISIYNGTVDADYTSEGYRYYFTSSLGYEYYQHTEQHKDYSFFKEQLTSPPATQTYQIVRFNNGDWGYRDEISFLDSVEVLGKIYYSVLECMRDGRQDEKIWIAKGVGIIARFFDHNSAFYLREIDQK